MIEAWVAAGAVLGIGAILLVQWHGRALLHREFYLHLIGANSQNELLLGREFSSFNELRSDVMYSAHAPRTHQQMIETLELTKNSEALRKCPHIIKGIDPWGQPLIFEITVIATEVEEEQQIVIRSIGVNGKDEAGRGDDLQARMINMWIPPIVRPTDRNGGVVKE